MLQAFALGALTVSGRIQVWHVLIFAGLLGTINAFDMPARQALVMDMTSREDLLNAISLNSAVFNAARIVGPGMAGLLVAAIGEGPCFLLNGASFLAVIFCLTAMRLPPSEVRTHPPVLQHLIDGFRYAARHRAVRRILIVMGAATFALMPGMVLMPFFADDIFHRGSRGYGVLLSGMGVGAVLGTLDLARRTRAHGLTNVMVYSGIGVGLAYMAFAVSNWFYLSLAIMPVIGFSVMRQMAAANTSIQTIIPEEYRGRIMALYAMTVVGLGPLGSLAAGAMAQRMGPRATMAAGGVVALVTAVLFAISLKRSPIVA